MMCGFLREVCVSAKYCCAVKHGANHNRMALNGMHPYTFLLLHFNHKAVGKTVCRLKLQMPSFDTILIKS